MKLLVLILVLCAPLAPATQAKEACPEKLIAEGENSGAPNLEKTPAEPQWWQAQIRGTATWPVNPTLIRLYITSALLEETNPSVQKFAHSFLSQSAIERIKRAMTLGHRAFGVTSAMAGKDLENFWREHRDATVLFLGIYASSVGESQSGARSTDLAPRVERFLADPKNSRHVQVLKRVLRDAIAALDSGPGKALSKEYRDQFQASQSNGENRADYREEVRKRFEERVTKLVRQYVQENDPAITEQEFNQVWTVFHGGPAPK